MAPDPVCVIPVRIVLPARDCTTGSKAETEEGSSLLTSTFQHLPGISPRKERELWNAGTMTWSDYVSSFRQADLFGEEAIPMLRESLSAWRQGDIGYFAARLPRPLHYRLALAFPHDSIFLDIETTGLTHHYHHLTLVGWSWCGRYGVFFAGSEPR